MGEDRYVHSMVTDFSMEEYGYFLGRGQRQVMRSFE